MVTGWPSCLRVVAALALLEEEASKLMLGQPLIVYTSHQVTFLLEGKGHFWLTDNRILKYQALLLENPDLRVMVCSSLNPATLLPLPEEGLPVHQCEDIICHSLLPRPDLTGIPLQNPEEVWFTDGSSFVSEGCRRAGYVMVSLTQVIEARTLPPRTSAQLAEIIALTQALSLSENKAFNVYTDSKYAFFGSACSCCYLEGTWLPDGQKQPN